MDQALREAEFAKPELSSRELRRRPGPRADPGYPDSSGAGFRARGRFRSGELLDDWRKKCSRIRSLIDYWLPTIRAAIDVDQKAPVNAIELLESRLALRVGRAPPIGGTLYPFTCAVTCITSEEGARSRHGISETSRSSRRCRELSLGCLGAPWPCSRLRHARRHRQSQGGLSGFPDALERRRP